MSLFILLFELKQSISLFLISKRGFLYSISLGLLFLNIIYFYSFQNKYLLITGVGLLFLVRFLMILMINKNLIIKELFYFILYLCAFELAPLFETETSPYSDLSDKQKVKIDFRPFIHVEGVTTKEVRAQKIDLSKFTAIVLTSRNAVDHFFRIAEEMRFKVPDAMKYFCQSEAVAYYLQ